MVNNDHTRSTGNTDSGSAEELDGAVENGGGR